MPNVASLESLQVPLPWQQGVWSRIFQQYERQRLAHAYLLSGEKGLGKMHFAWAFSRLVLCGNVADGRPCGSCRSCQLMQAGNHPDCQIIQPQEGSRVLKVDQIRSLAHYIGQTSHGGGRKVAILSPVDSLNVNAANALLKTLEEPAGDSVLLLLCDNPGRLLPTIRSRCQQEYFAIPSHEKAVDWLSAQSTGGHDLDPLLLLCGGRPLTVLQQMQDGKENLVAKILQEFLMFVHLQLDPVEFAQRNKELDTALILEYLWQLVVHAIRYQLSGTDDALANADLRILILSLVPDATTAKVAAMRKLLNFSIAIDQARHQAQSPSNPNRQLILESCMGLWLGLLKNK